MLPGILIEAHSYSGGLRYTAFPKDVSRPSWAPPADSVGWRDDFSFEGDDAVIEFHQRLHAGETVTWLAVYRKSVDAQFGDRSNHAGLGVWLQKHRIADARSLLLALDQYTVVLAASPDPSLLNDAMTEFYKFLGSYLVSADLLPLDWAGVPAAEATLVDTEYRFVRAPSFVVAVDRAADWITWLSLGWAPKNALSRAITLVTARSTLPVERDLKELDPPGGMLAEIVQRIPTSFDEERHRIRQAAAELASQKNDWEHQHKAERKQIETARRQSQTLDGQPATIEGIAARLNGLSRQMVEFREILQNIANRPAAKPETRYMAQPTYRPAETRHTPITRNKSDYTEHRSESTPPWTFYGIIAVIVVFSASTGFYFYWY